MAILGLIEATYSAPVIVYGWQDRPMTSTRIKHQGLLDFWLMNRMPEAHFEVSQSGAPATDMW